MKSKFIVLSMAILLVLAVTGFAYANTNNEELTTLQPKAVKSFSDDDYNRMINYMRENGYNDMADRMKSIDKDTMLKMHADMHGEDSLSRGTKSCH